MEDQLRPQGSAVAMEFDQPGDPPLQDDDVVISGMSSIMPGCENLKEWADKLYNKENMVTPNNHRWNYSHPELSPYLGQISGLDRFDAQFFMMNTKLAHAIDPGSRILLEQAHRVLFDAGVCQTEIMHKKVGVFIALHQSESEKCCHKASSGLVGCNRSMFANRISYWMNVTGPSYTIDSACIGSVVALERAYQAIMSGQCEAAFVGAVSLILHPMTLIHKNRLEPLNPDGKTKCYDINADGQSMSESISIIYLQKYKDARRVYAQLCHVKTEYSRGLDEKFMTKFGYYRDPEVLSKFLSNFYEEIGVSPSSVEYVEGLGAANLETDKSELQAIEEVFCKQRTNALLVGSVTSNIGFTDVVSGLNGIIKILHGYHSGVLAANLNCDNPRQDIAAIRDGRLKILTEHHPIKSYAAVNSFSVGGMNGHVLLKGHYINKDTSKYACGLPYLVTISSRQESGIEKILNSIKNDNLDLEKLALLRETFKLRTSNQLARGFGVFASDNKKTVTLCEKMNKYDGVKRPLWFVYSGMGSQWVGMGAQLMSIPIFAATILRCDKVLKTKGIELIKIITSTDETTLDNILNVFVGISAIQIALTDVLLAVGLVPDKMIGHSLGELGCAYADNCLTVEETILLAYSRGLISVQLPLIKGSMAAVGLGYKEVCNMCPPEIDVACHNGPDSSTLSGPAEIMHQFVKELTEKGIFAKEVKCGDIAYHSRYIAKAGPVFLKMGQSIIKTPKLRSKRWLSTSVPIDKWKQYDALYSSAEYHTNNLLNSVLFEEACRNIPNGAVLVEIAPHGLLQAILNRSLSSDCINIPLTKRGCPDSTVYLLEALGKLYMEDCDVDTRALYPKIEFPVSTRTPQLSHLVEHNHSDQWYIALYTGPERQFASTYKPIVSLYDDEHNYLKGSIIEGRREFPFAGALVFVWDLLAMSLGKKVRQMSVKFLNIRLYYQPLLKKNRPLELTISLHRASGQFEVLEDPNSLVAEGIIVTTNTNTSIDFPINDEQLNMTSTDIYKLFHERGYEYTGEFKSIQRANFSLTKANIAWIGNWTTFIDGVLQLISVSHEHEGVSQPRCVGEIVIDIDKHEEIISKNEDAVEANRCEVEDMTRCGGVLVKSVVLEKRPARTDVNVKFKTLKFVPFIQEHNDVQTNLYVALQIVTEYFGTNVIKVLAVSNNPKTDYFDQIHHLLRSEPKIKVNVTGLKNTEITNMIHSIEKPDLVVVNNEICNKEMTFNQLHQSLPQDTLLLVLGEHTNCVDPKLFKTIFAAGKKGKQLSLLKWVHQQRTESIVFPVKNTSDLVRLQNLRRDLSPEQSLTVLTTYPSVPGVKEVVKQLRAQDNFQANLAMVNCRKPELDLRKLHNLDLADSVFQNGKWGGEYYVPLEEFQSNVENAILHVDKPGDLNSLHWIEMNKDADHGIPVTVHYSALNINDAREALAEITSNGSRSFGMDFSGLNERKEPVMGLIPGGAVCTNINFKSGLLWPVPSHWSLEDAATVPLPYCLAFYCLSIKLKLNRGMNILIHGGAGALGQAAISICLAHGCTVFTTVSDNAKKRFLRELFHDLPANHIGNSRDDSFKDMVQKLTKGNGCEIIISNVKENLKNTTLTCCAIAGTTLDVLQAHDRNSFQYGMSYMTKARSYCIVDFSSIFREDNVGDCNKLQWMVTDGIARGYVRPLSRVTYTPSEVQRAFRLLAASRHRGRVLIQLWDQKLSTGPRITCSNKSSYLLLCDQEGLGLKLADKLVCSGAKKITLHLTSTSTLPHIFYKQRFWKKSGVEAKISYENINDKNSLEALIEEMNDNGSIDGIFIVQDGTIPESVLMKLDDVSRKLCPSLRYFVIINGQQIAQYICHKRSQIGIPGMSIKILHKKFGEENEDKYLLSWNSTVDAIEIAAQAKKPNVLAYVKRETQKNIIEEIAKIPGVRIPSSAVDKTTLEKIGIDHGRSQEICNLLEKNFNFKITKEEVPNLTIGQIKNWKMKTRDLKEEKHGIGAYFNFILPDELFANSELVLMPTMLIKSDVRADEFQIEDTQMFIIPGLEGHHKKFKPMCQRLKIVAAVLQYGYDNPNETIQETAQRFANVIIHKLKYKNHFYLLGYEYGVFVVLEIAAILESYGLTGTIFCLGGSPDEIRTDIESKLDGMPEWKVQNELIQHISYLATHSSPINLTNDLLKLQSFDKKVQLCIQTQQGQIPFSSQYLSDFIMSAYARIGFARHYKYDHPLMKANLFLIRTLPPITSNFPATASYELNVSLANALDNLECSAIINRLLETNVLENYSNRNLCESYLKNAGEMFVKFSIPNFCNPADSGI